MSSSINDFTSSVKAFALSKALMTAIDIDLFRKVASLQEKLSPQEMADSLGLNWNVCNPFFQILVSSNFLAIQDVKLILGPRITDEIIASMDNLIAWNEEMKLTYASFVDLTNIVKTGDYQATPLAAYWAYRLNPEHRDGGHELTSDYSSVMDKSQEWISKGIAQSYDFSGHSHLVDLGGVWWVSHDIGRQLPSDGGNNY